MKKGTFRIRLLLMPPIQEKRYHGLYKWSCHSKKVEVITNKGTILTHSGWDVMLYKLKLSSCQTNHLHVFLGGVQKLSNQRRCL